MSFLAEGIAMSSNYQAQYKSSATQQWQTKTYGSEMGCMQELARLREKYPFARVIDPAGRVVS
jgi:hypothetical protein